MHAKKLSAIVVEAGLVSRLTLDATLAKLKRGDALADRLVSDRAVAEVDLLKAMASATGCRFISGQRLAQTMVSGKVLGLVSPELAREALVLPFAYEAPSRSLAVVVADPKAIDQVPRTADVRQVVAHLALPSALKAAIKRLYSTERAPVVLEVPAGQCPHCRAPYFEGQLECARCGTLLDEGFSETPTDTQLVRALLVVPTGTHRVPSMSQVLDGPTRRGPALEVSDEAEVRLVADVEVMRTLSELEAFVVSLLDPGATVTQVIERCGLTAIEGRSVLASLAQRGVLRLEARPPAAPPAPPPPPPDLTPPTRPRGAVASSPALLASKRPLEESTRSREDQQTENSLQLALTLERRGEIEGALKVLHIAIARTSRPAPLFNRLALVLAFQRRDFKQAEEMLKKAMKLEPSNRVYQDNLAKVLMAAATKRR